MPDAPFARGVGYDAGDRATSIVESAAGTIGRTYDLLDRLTQETTPEGIVSYAHDDAGRRSSMTVAGQSAVSYTSDNADRLTGVAQGTASVTIAYDDADRRTSLTLPNGIVVEYGYDDDSRLTSLTYKLGGNTLGNLTYTYDAAASGRAWAAATRGPGCRRRRPRRPMTMRTRSPRSPGTAFTYDANGN